MNLEAINILWAAAAALILLLLGVVGWFVKRERDVVSDEVKAARAEAHENHAALSGKVDRVESEVSGIVQRMGRFITRDEAERAHDRFLAEQSRERAELKGFLTAWLERIERTLERKVDR